MIARSVELNGFQHVNINCAAVADVNGEAEFTVSSDNAYSSLRYSSRFSVARIVKVPVVTLDSYATELGLQHIDFLKVDAEGAEMRVLEGADGLLSNQQRSPKTIMLELYGPLLAAYGTDIEQVVEHLQRYGYLPFVTIGNRLVPFESWHKNQYWNVFFSRDRLLARRVV
jgi:FkbM family methyltransferase